MKRKRCDSELGGRPKYDAPGEWFISMPGTRSQEPHGSWSRRCHLEEIEPVLWRQTGELWKVLPMLNARDRTANVRLRRMNLMFSRKGCRPVIWPWRSTIPC